MAGKSILFENEVPEDFARVVRRWQKDLKADGLRGKKLLWNFRHDARVRKKQRDQFLENLSAEFKASIDPCAIPDRCITKCMTLKGPLARAPLPRRFARVETVNSLLEFRLGRIGVWRGRKGNHNLEGRVLEEIDKILRKEKEKGSYNILDDLVSLQFLDHPQGFLWISDADQLEGLYAAKSADSLRDWLGLEHFRKKEIMVVMTFTLKSISNRGKGKDRKTPRLPTVCEARNYTAFTPVHPPDPHCGYLINLQDGERTLPEWVCEKVKITKDDFSFLKPSSTIPDQLRLKKDPPNDFLRKYAKMIDGET